MARLLDDALGQYLTVNSAPVTAPPFTMACFAYSNDDTVHNSLMWIGDKDSSVHYWVLYLWNGNKVRFATRAGNGFTTAATTTLWSVNTWHHLICEAVTTSDRSVWIDNAGKGSDTAIRAPTGVDRYDIGHWGPSTGIPLSGRIFWPAVWNAILTGEEHAMLNLGISPLLVRPQSLVSFTPLVNDEDIDIVGGLSFTAINSPTVIASPRVFMEAA